MSRLKQKLIISLKSTLPTYILISTFTLFFLNKGKTMLSFSQFGDSLGAKLLFSLAFNLLYFIPQFTGIFIGLHTLRNKNNSRITLEKVKWFLRIPAPIAVITTLGVILTYYLSGFFPKTVDGKQLYIIFIIIILMNIIFSVIMTINIYSQLLLKMKYPTSKITESKYKKSKK